VAETWEDFVRLIKEFKPQLVYYYGHGEGDGKKTRLIFAQGKNRNRTAIPVTDFALCLRNMAKPPLLVYVNCCLGDAGSFLGAGMQLGDFILAVITNRAIVYISAAQSQAIALWKNILLRAVPPHQAVATLYARMTDQNLSSADIPLDNPVFHCHYSQWKAKPRTPPDRLTDDPQNQFALLSISFIVKNPPDFHGYIEEKQFDGLDLKYTDFWLLNAMEKVAQKDLLRFLRTHNIRLPVERRDRVLKKILKKTGGQYEQTIEALKKLRREAWQVTEETGEVVKNSREKNLIIDLLNYEMHVFEITKYTKCTKKAKKIEIK